MARGYSHTNGNAILNVYNSVVSNNNGVGNNNNNGVGIHILYGIGNIKDSVISNNIATGGTGGGIFVDQGDVSITNTLISNNVANDAGGLYFQSGTTHTTIIIRQSSFVNNSATEGKDIYGHSGAITLVNTVLPTEATSGQV